MNLSELGKWILNFLNSDPFLDWFFTTLPGLFLWLLSSWGSKKPLLSMPVWPTVAYGNKQEKMLHVRSYLTQIVGLLTMIWSLLLAFTTTNHQQRINLYGAGLCILLVLASLVVIVVELKS